MTDDQQITVCPECDRADIRRRHPDKPVGPDVEARWHCKVCDARFDEPAERERHVDSTPRGLAGELAAAESLREVVGDD